MERSDSGKPLGYTLVEVKPKNALLTFFGVSGIIGNTLLISGVGYQVFYFEVFFFLPFFIGSSLIHLILLLLRIDKLSNFDRLLGLVSLVLFLTVFVPLVLFASGHNRY